MGIGAPEEEPTVKQVTGMVGIKHLRTAMTTHIAKELGANQVSLNPSPGLRNPIFE